jgi:hypothetical protein
MARSGAQRRTKVPRVSRGALADTTTLDCVGELTEEGSGIGNVLITAEKALAVHRVSANTVEVGKDQQHTALGGVGHHPSLLSGRYVVKPNASHYIS